MIKEKLAERLIFVRQGTKVTDEVTFNWGISSVGRAPALHAGGQEFEPPILHIKRTKTLIFVLFCFLSGCFSPQMR